MKTDVIERIRADSESIMRLQGELVEGMRSLTEEIGQDKPLRHETVESITEQMRMLEKLQGELIAKIGEDVSYADAMRFSREDFGGFFTITSSDDGYREAIEALGAEFLARGHASVDRGGRAFTRGV